MKWKDIPGWEGFYQASTSGKIRSVNRTIFVKNPWGIFADRKFKGRILSAAIFGKGYFYVWITSPNKKKFTSVHSLIALTFLGERPKGKEVLHKNGKKLDCRLVNLRYGTSSENSKDKFKHGYKAPIGFSNKNSKLNKSDYLYIKNNRSKISARKMGIELKVSHSSILNAFKNIDNGIL